MIRDGQVLSVHANGQDWLVSWHPPQLPPAGTRHGSSGVCVTDDQRIILISNDGQRWDLPGGRPEGSETWEETLYREMLEEVCAIVVRARLLGFTRSECIRGVQSGLILIRSQWRADVQLLPWQPQFEVVHRLILDPATELEQIVLTDGSEPIIYRTIHEALLS